MQYKFSKLREFLICGIGEYVKFIDVIKVLYE